MKKSVIWLLIVLMGVTFSGLMVLQYTYIRTLSKTRAEQFDESVRRTIFQVVRNLELDETARYLEDELDNREVSTLGFSQFGVVSGNKSSHLLTIGNSPSFSTAIEDDEVASLSNTGPQVFTSMSQGNTLYNTSAKVQETLRERYLAQKGFMDDVILRMLYEANDKPIEQRIDFSQLEHYLMVELTNNGLGNIPFIFRVTDKDDREVYRCRDMIGAPRKAYKQTLFPNDPGIKTGTLYLTFPKRKNQQFENMKIFVPSVLLSIVLLIVFGFTIIIIFKQRKLSDMKNDFVNNMTHELKTPISTISLAAQMLRDVDVGKTPTMLKHISGVIVDETKRLGFQVEKVLQVSLFERDNANLTFKEVDVNEMLENVIVTFKLKVENFDGTIHQDLKATVGEITADEMHLTNVFFNLMDNAVKYRSPDRDLNLQVSTWNEKDSVVIAIRDNGIGIRKEHLKKVFDRFFRVPTGNVHNVKGFGLGLAYVRKIVENHNGTIRAESELNVGTEFIINLPLIKE